MPFRNASGYSIFFSTLQVPAFAGGEAQMAMVIAARRKRAIMYSLLIPKRFTLGRIQHPSQSSDGKAHTFWKRVMDARLALRSSLRWDTWLG
jgi:hypothetical protein